MNTADTDLDLYIIVNEPWPVDELIETLANAVDIERVAIEMAVDISVINLECTNTRATMHET